MPQRAVLDISDGTLTLDAVAQMIVEHGFLDVDFESLSQHFDIPVSELEDASDGSLLNAVEHALRMALAELEWPVVRTNWKDMVYDSAMTLWNFFEKFPGYARLISAGIAWDIPNTLSIRFMNKLRGLGFNEFELRLTSVSVIGMIMSHYATKEALQTRTGDIAEMYSDFLTYMDGESLEYPPMFAKYKVMRQREPKLFPDEESEYVTATYSAMDKIVALDKVSIIDQRLKTIISGIELNREVWDKNGALTAGREETMAKHKNVFLPPLDFKGLPTIPPLMDRDNVKIDCVDDIARLVVDHGFLDVSYDKLSKTYRIPVSQFYDICPDLARAVERAMDLEIEESVWPFYIPDWRTFLMMNALGMWHFYKARPGYARLLGNGMIGKRNLVKLGNFISLLKGFGFTANDATVIINTIMVPVLDECAGADAIYSFSGNIAELSPDFADETASRAWDGRLAFESDWKPECMGFQQDMQRYLKLINQATTMYFGVESNLGNEFYARRLAATITGLSHYYSEDNEDRFAALIYHK